MSTENEDMRLDLNELCIKNPGSTYFARIRSKAWEAEGILTDDILVVDRFIEPDKNSLILVVIGKEFSVKRFVKELKGLVYLQAGSTEFPFTVKKNTDQFVIWGVVVAVVRLLRPEVRNG